MRFNDRSLNQTISRLQTLLSFLQSAEDFRVEIVLSTQARDGNLTILGDWFVAESLVPRQGGYRQTVFNWHASTVSRWIKRFDEQFGELCLKQGLTPESSCGVAIQQISRITW